MHRGPEYLVASRQGIYRVTHTAWEKLAEGHYFGLTLIGPQVYCFQSVSAKDAARERKSGKIVRFTWDGAALGGAEILADGLDYNCHQIDFHDGLLWVADTGHQRLLAYDGAWRLAETVVLGPPCLERGPDDAHINSFHARDERIWLLFHNDKRGIPSEIVEYDRSFREQGRIRLPSAGCHDVVALEDGSLLYCHSPQGEIAVAGGASYKIDDLYTRGLSVGADEIAVGSSLYGARFARELLPGFLTFLDRNYNQIARVYLPAAPTQIRRLDAADLSFAQPR